MVKQYDKVFFFGMGKTGTTTFHALFESIGRKSLHRKYWIDDTCIRYTKTFEDFDIFTDGSTKCDFKWLYETFSDKALYVLNYRKLDDWLVSRWNHCERNKKRILSNTINLDVLRRRDPNTKELILAEPLTKNSLEDIIKWIIVFNNFKKRLIDFFKDKPTFVTVNISDKEEMESFIRTYIDDKIPIREYNSFHNEIDYVKMPDDVKKCLDHLNLKPEDYSKIFIPELL
jgi:hypothetical protein